MILASFLFFTGLVAAVTIWWTHKDDHGTTEGYFLAGRSLTWPLIAGSLLLTNLSTEQMVGLNGAAFTYGFSVMVWEVVAVLALVAMALFFLPRFLILAQDTAAVTLPGILSDGSDIAILDAVRAAVGRSAHDFIANLFPALKPVRLP